MDFVAQPSKVLVVDDERPIAITLAAILQSQGYETTTAFSGEEAIETARQVCPDFLLSDIRMPGINGVEAAMRILEFLPGCSVLFISAYTSDEVLAGARKRGYNFEVCAKPIPPPALLRKVAEVISRPSPPPLTVLNVDDDEIYRYATTRILKHAGFTVLEAATGAEALRLAQTRPDAILLDVRLPDISGFEVCRKLKANPETARIPIINLTSEAHDDLSENVARRLGADAFLTHPVDSERLLALLRTLGNRKTRPPE